MIAVALFLCACAAYWVWRRKDTKDTEPPRYPGAWPIIGNLHALFGNSCRIWTRLNIISEKLHEMGGVVTASFGPQTVYIACDPDDVFTITNACLAKDDLYDFGKPFLGEGLVTAKASIWKNHRKLLNPSFNQSLLDTFMGVFNSQSRKLVQEMEKEDGKGPFDPWIYTRCNALETICLTSLGVEFTEMNISPMQYLDAMEKMFSATIERIIKIWWHSPYTFAFSLLKMKQDECIKVLHNMSNTVLQKRKSEYARKVNAVRSTTSGSKFKPFLDLILELSAEKGVFNDTEIREQVDTMIFGGHDTSSLVLVYAMILLGSHREAQEKTFKEIQEVLGDGDRDVEKTDLSKLVYVEAVLKETIRVYTIAPVIARKLDKDVKLKNYTLSAGRSCYLFLFGIHKHPMWGPDVHEFKPERWLEPGRLPDNPNAFAGFSYGRRNCIGKAYALMSMKTSLAHLIRRYQVSADHTKMQLKMEVILKPHSGYFVSIEKRTKTINHG
ncbi:cytochrome P450 4C1-like [Trichoplusia ni]|uniref:Cytochrome P450 4C1-like n=1 Tax=Trichoplusia ni TaxID=7111 RepID=A0A7E5W186_TRINI|nr:cytochrome P450 4C1-like [Trichoplusia ni]